MGTSGAFPGPKNDTPLVPTWLDVDDQAPLPATPPIPLAPVPQPPAAPGAIPPAPTAPTPRAPLPPLAHPNRFQAPRTNFTAFARSGGRDRASLGRAISGYVASGTGGARTAARRMGSSRMAADRLAGFLADVRSRGADQALRALDLGALAGRPIDEVFVGLADYICPDGGSIDEGIARDAFFETVAELAAAGVTDLNALSVDQMQTVLELFATHSIETRLCNDIGAKVVTMPSDIREAKRVQDQLRDFIRRGVADALTSARAALETLTRDRVRGFAQAVYESAFSILQALGAHEAEA